MVMNWIWNRVLTKECVVTFIGIIAILLLVSWFFIEKSEQLQVENEQLAGRISWLRDRQIEIDRAILEGMKCIYDALPRPVNYVEVYDE
jgi:Na+/H+ antiporter NhaD/arsenite permease-like protein